MTEDLFKRALDVGRHQAALLSSQDGGGWVVFFRKVLSHVGVLRRTMFCNDDEAWAEFLCSRECAHLQIELARMRSGDDHKMSRDEPFAPLFLRVPVSVRESLMVEADECGMSMQNLALTKLLQGVDRRVVPVFRSRRRGRKAESKVVFNPTQGDGGAKC